MTYESLNDLESDWYKLGHLEIVTENGNMSVKSNKALTPMQAAEILACVWNQIPKMVEEMRLSRGMREIQGVCRRTEASAGKPLHSLYRRHEQKAQS